MACRFLSTIVCVDYDSRNGYTMCLSESGELLSFGNHNKGAHGQIEKLVFPPKVIPLLNITSFGCGMDHSVCLDNNGNVYSFGSNEFGQLGIGKSKFILNHTHKPRKVNLPPIKQVSCGNNFAICISEEGGLFSFGCNKLGQLGLENNKSSKSPKQLEFCEVIDFIECGGNHVICKTLNDDVYAWGCNGYGQLGIENKCDAHLLPTKCINWPKDIIDIKCGFSHTVILTSNREVYTVGNNQLGQLGRKSKNDSRVSIQKLLRLSDIIRIECGYYHSLCIDTQNRLIVFGGNGYGQLGLGDDVEYEYTIIHPSLSNIIDISSKGCHTFVKTYSNQIYSFGLSFTIQIGSEIEDYQFTPMRVFQDNETIWCSNINISRAKSARK